VVFDIEPFVNILRDLVHLLIPTLYLMPIRRGVLIGYHVTDKNITYGEWPRLGVTFPVPAGGGCVPNAYVGRYRVLDVHLHWWNVRFDSMPDAPLITTTQFRCYPGGDFPPISPTTLVAVFFVTFTGGRCTTAFTADYHPSQFILLLFCPLNVLPTCLTPRLLVPDLLAWSGGTRWCHTDVLVDVRRPICYLTYPPALLPTVVHSVFAWDVAAT